MRISHTRTRALDTCACLHVHVHITAVAHTPLPSCTSSMFLQSRRWDVPHPSPGDAPRPHTMLTELYKQLANADSAAAANPEAVSALRTPVTALETVAALAKRSRWNHDPLGATRMRGPDSCPTQMDHCHMRRGPGMVCTSPGKAVLSRAQPALLPKVYQTKIDVLDVACWWAP